MPGGAPATALQYRVPTTRESGKVMFFSFLSPLGHRQDLLGITTQATPPDHPQAHCRNQKHRQHDLKPSPNTSQTTPNTITQLREIDFWRQFSRIFAILAFFADMDPLDQPQPCPDPPAPDYPSE